MLRRVALVITDVSEEPGASFIKVTRIGELGTTQAATSNRRTSVLVASCSLCCSYFTDSCHPDEGGARFLPKRRFLQVPHGVTSKKTPFFIVTAVETWYLTLKLEDRKWGVDQHVISCTRTSLQTKGFYRDNGTSKDMRRIPERRGSPIISSCGSWNDRFYKNEFHSCLRVRRHRVELSAVNCIITAKRNCAQIKSHFVNAPEHS
jgi:hypothetical protein